MNAETQATVKPKKPYTAPRLVSYGAVRALTQASTKGPNESSSKQTNRMASSDRGTKENIVRIGEHPLGIGLYLFDYKPEYRETWGHGRQFGVMAQEVEVVMPEAVLVHSDGYKMVDYALLGICQRMH